MTDRAAKSPREFHFGEKLSVEDIPRLELGPDLSDGVVDDFIGFHPGSDDADAEDQLWELVDYLLDAADDGVSVSRNQSGEWGLVSRKPYGYRLLLSPDGDVVLAYATTRRSKTFRDVSQGHEERRERRLREQDLRQRAVTRAKHERRLAQRQVRLERAAARRQALAPQVNVSRARDMAHMVMQSRIGEGEARRRAEGRGFKKEFDAELRRARRDAGGSRS